MNEQTKRLQEAGLGLSPLNQVTGYTHIGDLPQQVYIGDNPGYWGGFSQVPDITVREQQEDWRLERLQESHLREVRWYKYELDEAQKFAEKYRQQLEQAQEVIEMQRQELKKLRNETI